MSNLKYYDQIQAYLSGDLPKNQQENFEKELSTNKELKLEYDATLAADDAIAILGYQKIKQDLNQQVATVKAVKPKSRRIFLWAAAASILLLITALVHQFFRSSSKSPKELALDYFASPNLASIRNASNPQNPLKIGAIAYEQTKYQAAINQLVTIEKTNNLYGDAQFLIGCAQLKLGNELEAKNAFNLAIQANTKFSEDANWNLMIAMLQNGEIEHTINALNTIEQSNSITNARKTDINKLLKELSGKE